MKTKMEDSGCNFTCLQTSFLRKLEYTLINELCKTGFSLDATSFIRKVKDLSHGDFTVPRGCLPHIEPQLFEETKTLLLQKSQNWEMKIGNITTDPYSAFIFHLRRPECFKHTLQEVLLHKEAYGVHFISVTKSVLLNSSSFSAIREKTVDEISIDTLRSIVLLQHILLLLKAHGYDVVCRDLGTLPESLKHLVSLIGLLDTSCKWTNPPAQELIHQLCYRAQQFQTRQKYIPHDQVSACNRDEETGSYGRSFDIGVSRGNKRDLTSSSSRTESDKDTCQECMHLKNIVVDLEQYIKLKSLAVGKGGYDKNIKNVEVVSNGKESSYLSEVAELEQCIKTCPVQACVHVVSQSQAFNQQRVDILWQILTEEPVQPLVNQSHFLYGTVTCRKNSQIEKINAHQFYNLRYQQLKQAFMIKYAEQVTGQGWEDTIAILTMANIKFELLASTARNMVKLDLSHDIADGTLGDAGGGAFVMYNCARLSTLLSHFQESVDKGLYPSLPPIEEVDFSTLREQEEWHLLFQYVLAFPQLVQQAVGSIDGHDRSNINADIQTHKICNMLMSLSRLVSSYYSRIHVLGESRAHLLPQMFGRIYLLKGVHQVMVNGLALMGIPPLSQL
ncbi:hypothetical protein CHS0354_004754 [Potamilus streckersoni]|uniref:DALR anticodon binding domain-containing protein n=1 Tax=Potamilus streckersoni TaxID=2493646 RepID=A0AAE0TD02_9BIVA|nr:hypothetical protein CHS0354_004754 [Potamilus streckersoni]